MQGRWPRPHQQPCHHTYDPESPKQGPQLEDEEAVNIPVLKMLKHVAKEGPPCYLVVEANSSPGCGTLKPCYLLHLTAI